MASVIGHPREVIRHVALAITVERGISIISREMHKKINKISGEMEKFMEKYVIQIGPSVLHHVEDEEPVYGPHRAPLKAPVPLRLQERNKKKGGKG